MYMIWRILGYLENIFTFWRTFLRFGEYANYIKLLLNAKADTVKPSVTASLTTDMTHAENSKTQLLTKEMVGPVGFEPTTTPL